MTDAPMTAVATRPAYDTCGAKTRSGGQCRRPAGWGTDHAGAGCCKLHFGATPAHGTRARRMLANAAAMASLAEVEVVPIGDPLEALAELAAEAWAWKGHLADMVAQLKEQYRFTDDKHTEQLDARVALLERAMDRCQKFLSDWVRLGFEDRKVRVDEARAAMVAVVLAGVLRDLGHDPESEGVLGVLDRWLPVLDGGPSPVIDVKETS